MKDFRDRLTKAMKRLFIPEEYEKLKKEVRKDKDVQSFQETLKKMGDVKDEILRKRYWHKKQRR